MINLSHHKTRPLVERIINWCEYNVNENPKEISAKLLNQIFSNSTAGKFLKDFLLIREGKYVPTVKSFSYKLNRLHINELKKQFHVDNKKRVKDDPFAFLSPTLIEELRTGEFNYKFSSDRHWHRLQFIVRAKKKDFWDKFGYTYDYDISSAQGNILFQYGKSLGIIRDNTYLGLRDYIKDTNEFRDYTRRLLHLPNDAEGFRKTKQIITAILNGAKIANNPYCQINNIIGDTQIFREFQINPRIRSLRCSICMLSRALRRRQDVKSTGDFLSSIYRKQEHIIMDEVRRYLVDEDIKYFTEHDGFRTKSQVDVIHLSHYIFKKQNFSLIFN